MYQWFDHKSCMPSVMIQTSRLGLYNELQISAGTHHCSLQTSVCFQFSAWPTMMFIVSISILSNKCPITQLMKSCQIYSMGTKSLNPFQRKNTGMSKVNSSSTTVCTKELISLPILVLHPVSHSCELLFGHLRICRLSRIVWE